MITGKTAAYVSAATITFLLAMWLFFGSGGRFIYKKKDENEEPDHQYNLIRFSMLDPLVENNVDQTPVVKPEIERKPKKGRDWKKNPSNAEMISRAYMEQQFGVPFPATYPNWLVNPETGRKLELDCYNEDLKIAVECNGEHHYVWPNWTKATYQKFLNVVRKDDYKRAICDKMGVYLITVPYNVKPKKIGEFIASQFPKELIA
jgi:hypothetical protein